MTTALDRVARPKVPVVTSKRLFVGGALFADLFTERDRDHMSMLLNGQRSLPPRPSGSLSIDNKRRQTLSAGCRRYAQPDDAARVAFHKKRSTAVLAPSLETVHKTVVFLFCPFQSGVSVLCAGDVQGASLFWWTRSAKMQHVGMT